MGCTVSVVTFACSQIRLTSFGMIYQSGSTGTVSSSSGVSTRAGDRIYCPTKSAFAMTSAFFLKVLPGFSTWKVPWMISVGA